MLEVEVFYTSGTAPRLVKLLKGSYVSFVDLLPVKVDIQICF